MLTECIAEDAFVNDIREPLLLRSGMRVGNGMTEPNVLAVIETFLGTITPVEIISPSCRALRLQHKAQSSRHS